MCDYVFVLGRMNIRGNKMYRGKKWRANILICTDVYIANIKRG